MTAKNNLKTHRESMGNYVRYLDTYNGKELLKMYSLDQVGIWEIRGEDPNCDMGGAHVQPKLGIVQGKLQDIIMFGVNLDRFWQWGGGGSITFIGETIPLINSTTTEEIERLEDEARELTEALNNVQRRLKNLQGN